MDDFESPEVQKDFPGLYTPGPSKNKKEEAEFPPDKEKKDKKKDKGYATLACNESSPDEDGDTKSPSKSTKRIKAFKFPLKKEKREKSRDKDQAPSSTKKEKKERKLKSATGPGDDLGESQPIFGVQLAVAVERSRCHDIDNPLPLVVRDCIDYLQEFGGEGIYKSPEPAKETKLQQLKKLYNNRESNGLQDLDTVTAAALLKLYLRELPEPILTTDLLTQFEEVSANSDVQEQEAQLQDLVDQLPPANRTLLKWMLFHLDAVAENTNAQSLAVLMSPVLQTSHRLFATLLCHCRSLFLPASTDTAAEPVLPRYIPPLSGTNPVLPESREGIQQELGKQESLLTQIHSEMNSGFVTKRREEQLWEVQRIITQLKRKLRQVDKKGGDSTTGQKSVEDAVDSITIDPMEGPKSKSSDENSDGVVAAANATSTPPPPPTEGAEQRPLFNVTHDGLLTLPKDHPDASDLVHAQLENYELQRWREQLQAAVNQERAELNMLKQQLKERQPVDSPEQLEKPTEQSAAEVQELLARNAHLECIRQMLCDEILAENRRIVDLRVQLLCATTGSM